MSEQDAGIRAPVQKRQMNYLEFIDESPMTNWLWLLVCGMCLAQLLDGLDFQATSFAIPGIIREFRINPAQAGGISSVGNLGVMLGTIFAPMLCSRVGRKLLFQWVLLTYAVGTLISAVAPTMTTLLVARFVAGLGIGSQFPIVASILAEFSPKKLRHRLVPLGPMFSSAGWFFAALVALLLIPHFGWRAIYLVGILPAVFTVYLRYGMPESVRFLLSRGETKEAGAVVRDLAKKAKMGDIELVPPPVEKGQVALSLGQQLATLRTVWVPMAVLILFYFCSMFQTFGMNAWLPTVFVRAGYRPKTSFAFTLMIMAATPFGMILAMWVQNVLKRKWALFALATGGTIFFLIFGMSFQYKWPVVVLVGSQTLMMLFSQGVVPILWTITTELMPNSVRTLGMGFVNGFARFGAVLAPSILGLALKSGMVISEIIYLFAIPLFVCAVVVVFVIKVDTRQRSLESINQEYRKEIDKAMPAQTGR